ncbi:hypothetical protein GGR52DRAFT_509737 [Hypoxylon sp. FL1284]|nr:hypothetical protein GGR52DRAFT_509737 [Hypoxylon sp. FL1284]
MTWATFTAHVAQRLDRDLSMYVGPGQVVVWPVLDLLPTSFAYHVKHQIEEILGPKVARSLRRTFARLQDATYEGGSGIWVQSRHFQERRQIADVHVNIEDGILSSGITFNVESPIVAPAQANPWSLIEAADVAFSPVTSIAVEHGLAVYELGRFVGNQANSEHIRKMNGNRTSCIRHTFRADGTAHRYVWGFLEGVGGNG